MNTEKYSFEEFMERMKPLDYEDVIVHASIAVDSVEKASYDRPGAVAARAGGSILYANRVKDFLFFMRTGSLPAGMYACDRRLYREIAENLVKKKQLTADILNVFKGDK